MSLDLTGKAVKILRLPTVDYSSHTVSIIPAKKYDNKSRYLYVTLYDDRGDISLSNYCRAILNATLPDGSKQTISFGASNFDANKNVVVCEIPGTFMSQEGRVVCDVTLFSQENASSDPVTISSQDFSLFVVSGQYSDSATSGTSEYSALHEILAEVEGYKRDITDHLMDISYVGSMTENIADESEFVSMAAISSTANNYGALVEYNSEHTSVEKSVTSGFIKLPNNPKTESIFLSYEGMSGRRGFSRFTRVFFYDESKTVLTVGDDGTTNPNYASASLVSDGFSTNHPMGEIAVPSNAAYVRFTADQSNGTLSNYMVSLEYKESYVKCINGFVFNKPLVGYLTEEDARNIYATKESLDNYAPMSLLDEYSKKDELNSYATKEELSSYATKSLLSKYATEDLMTDNYFVLFNPDNNCEVENGKALSIAQETYGNLCVPASNPNFSSTSALIELPEILRGEYVYLSYATASSSNRGYKRITRIMFYDRDGVVLTVGDDGESNPNYEGSALVSDSSFGGEGDPDKDEHADGKILVPNTARYIRFTVYVQDATLSKFMVSKTQHAEYIAPQYGINFSKPLVGYLTEEDADNTYAKKSSLDDYATKATLSSYATKESLSSYERQSVTNEDLRNHFELKSSNVNIFDNTIIGNTALSVQAGTYGNAVTPSSNPQNSATSGWIYIPSGSIGKKLYLTYKASSGNRGCTRFTRIIFYDINKTALGNEDYDYKGASLISESYEGKNNSGNYLTIPDGASYLRFTVNVSGNTLTEYMVSFDENTSGKSSKYVYPDIGYTFSKPLNDYTDNKSLKNGYVARNELYIDKTKFIPYAQIRASSPIAIVKSDYVYRRVYYVPIPSEHMGDTFTLSNDYGNYLCVGSFEHDGNMDDFVSAYMQSMANDPLNTSLSVNLTYVDRNSAPMIGSSGRGKSYFTGSPVTICPSASDNYICFVVAIADDFESSTPTDQEVEDVYNKILSTTKLVFGDGEFIHAPYESSGAYYAVQKAEQFLNKKWTPVRPMPRTKDPVGGVNEDVFPAGKEITGLPYSSVKMMNKFIGIDVLLETFITALENPNSILYTYDARTGQSSQNKEKVYNVRSDGICSITIDNLQSGIKISHSNASCYYGTVCSSLVGYSIGLPTYETTYSWSNPNTFMNRVINKSYYSLKRGDTMLNRNMSGGGHTSLISDIERDKTGEVKYITVTESSHPVIKQTRYAPQEFINHVFTDAYEDYSGVSSRIPVNDIYRYSRLDYSGCMDYDASVLRKNGNYYEAYLDASFEEVGCVFLDDYEIFDYEYVAQDCLLKIPASSIPNKNGDYVKYKRIKVGGIDTWRSFFMPEYAYNHNPNVMLDRGNKSVYRFGWTVNNGEGTTTAYGDNIIITVGRGYNGVCIDGDVFFGVDSGSYYEGTNGVTISAGILANGYHTARAANGTADNYTLDETNVPVEFLVYDTGTITIGNSYNEVSTTTDENGVTSTKYTIDVGIGKVTGSVSGFSEEIKPYYVELCSKESVVKYTSFIDKNEDGTYTFEVGDFDASHTIGDGNINGTYNRKYDCAYLKVHYKCKYGRVVSETFRIIDYTVSNSIQ